MIILILAFGRVFPSILLKQPESLNQQNSLDISENVFFRQTYNNCAPYSVMAVMNILRDEFPDPEKLALETPWRIQRNLTFPQGVISQLIQNQITVKEYTLWLYNNERKVSWLQNQIDLGKPVILLIEIHHIKHYVTVLGYDQDGFMLYDSNQEKLESNPRMTIDDNPMKEGNRYYSTQDLLSVWRDGGYKIFFQYWAISCDTR